MDATNTNDDVKKQSEVTNQQKSPFTSSTSLPKSTLNGDAKPFVPTELIGDSKKIENGTNRNAESPHETFTLKVPLSSKIWQNISARSQTRTTPTTNEQSNTRRSSSARSIFEQPKPPERSLLLNILPDGLIHIFRRDNIHIDLTLDKAIRVVSPLHNIVVTVSNTATAVAIFHPNGRIVQNNSRVDVVAFDGLHYNNYLRYAKLWFKGISFTSKDIPLVYLVDEAGLRTTVDRFIDIKDEYAADVFNRNARYGPQFFEEAVDLVEKSSQSVTLDGFEKLEINQIRILSGSDGSISIQRPNNKCSIRINPRKSSISLTTPTIHCTASMGPSPHLFLRRGDRRIHFDGKVFCVRMAGHSAGFNERNQVTIFNKHTAPTFPSHADE